MVPDLIANPPGRGIRTIGLVVPGVRRVSAQIEPYTQWWTDQNAQAIEQTGPLWVAIGDSTSIGIGATAPERGWVGVALDALRARVPDARVINLAMSGARVGDALDRQLPVLASLVAAGQAPALVTCCIGTNDVIWSNTISRANRTTQTGALRTELRSLVTQLPATSAVALVAGASDRARSANRLIREEAARHDFAVVDPWSEPGPGPRARVAEDRFHPNDLGYSLMAAAFLRAIAAAMGAGP